MCDRRAENGVQGELGVKVRVGLSLGLLVGAKVRHISYIPYIPLRPAETVRAARSSASRSRSSSRRSSTR